MSFVAEKRSFRAAFGPVRGLAIAWTIVIATVVSSAAGAAEKSLSPIAPVIVTTITAAPLSESETAEAVRLAQGVTIYRDSYGVPHIHGKTDAHVAFGYAFAQAED